MRFFRWPSSAKRPVGDPDAWGDVLGGQPIIQGPIEHGMYGVLGPRRTCLAIAALLLSFVIGAQAQQSGMGPALVYDAQTRGPVPIPSSERGLQTVVAEPWFKVSDEALVLEGPAFDRDGNLLFCDVSGRRVLRLTPDKQLSTLVSLDQLGPGGLAVHKDRRVFIAAMVLTKGVGSIVPVEPDGSGMRTIVPPEAGYMPNDLVFDARGGFYFTDFRGASTDPKGGSTTSRRTSGRSRPRCRVSPWPTASRSARTAGNCGPPSSAGICCTGSSWRTRQRPRRSARPSPTILPARRRTPCVPMPTAISTWLCTGKAGSWSSTRTASPWPGAVSGPRPRPQPTIHQHGDQAR